MDGASADLSIAVAEPDGTLIRADQWTSAQRQSAELLPRLIDLVAASGRSLDSVSAVAVGIGPGSFTGLRVALALAKGLAFSLERPIVGVPSLEAWLASDPAAEAALARAGAREAYVLQRDHTAPVIGDHDRVRERLRTEPVVAPDELAAAIGLERATPPRAAAWIAARAAARLEEGDADDVRRLEPVYLRAPRGLEREPEGAVRWL
jgi:tRNA threonylcarbamoyl adenosine modification protein YeaZ